MNVTGKTDNIKMTGGNQKGIDTYTKREVQRECETGEVDEGKWQPFFR